MDLSLNAAITMAHLHALVCQITTDPHQTVAQNARLIPSVQATKLASTKNVVILVLVLVAQMQFAT